MYMYMEPLNTTYTRVAAIQPLQHNLYTGSGYTATPHSLYTGRCTEPLQHNLCTGSGYEGRDVDGSVGADDTMAVPGEE